MCKEWLERGTFISTEQRTADQARAIRRNGWLTEIELDGIKRKVLNEDIQQGQANVERQEQNLPLHSEEKNEFDSLEGQSAGDSSYWEQIREYPEMDDYENGILNSLLEIISNKEYRKIASFNRIDRCKLNTIIQKVITVSNYTETDDITQTNNLLRAVSTLVGENWGYRLEGEIMNRKSHGGKEGLRGTSLSCASTLVYNIENAK